MKINNKVLYKIAMLCAISLSIRGNDLFILLDNSQSPVTVVISCSGNELVKVSLGSFERAYGKVPAQQVPLCDAGIDISLEGIENSNYRYSLTDFTPNRILGIDAHANPAMSKKMNFEN